MAFASLFSFWAVFAGHAALAAGSVDQSQALDDATWEFGWNGSTAGNVACQSFKPAGAALAGFDLKLGRLADFTGASDARFVITSGGCYGQPGATDLYTHVLGAAEGNTISTSGPDLFHHELPAPLAVTPGGTYWISVASGNYSKSPAHWLQVRYRTTDGYADGHFRSLNDNFNPPIVTEHASADLWFKTYAAVSGPDPVGTYTFGWNGSGSRNAVCQGFKPAEAQMTGFDLSLGRLADFTGASDARFAITSGGCVGQSGATELYAHVLDAAEGNAISSSGVATFHHELSAPLAVTPGGDYWINVASGDYSKTPSDWLVAGYADPGPYADGHMRAVNSEVPGGQVTDMPGRDLVFQAYTQEPPPAPIKVAVILADLADVTHADPATLTQPCKLLDQDRAYASYRDYYEDMFYCVNDYYRENTYGRVRFEFTVFDDGGGWYDLPGTQAEYAGSSVSVIQALRNDALLAAFDDMSALNPFDIRVIVHPGYTQVTTPKGVMWDVGYNYSAAEPRGVHVSSRAGLGVWAHELGHVVGPILGFDDGASVIPDLYNLGNIGKWDVMATGLHNAAQKDPSSFSSLTRSALGVLDTQSITPNSTQWVTALNSKTYGDTYLKLDLDEGDGFMLLEARNSSSAYGNWDTSLPEDEALVLIYGDTSENTYTIPGNGPQERLLGVEDGILDPDAQESYRDFDHRIVLTALGDRVGPDGAYQIEAGIRDMSATDFLEPYVGQILRPTLTSGWRAALTLSDQVGLADEGKSPLEQIPNLSSFAVEDPIRITPLGVGLGIALTFGGTATVSMLLYAILSLSRRGREYLKIHGKGLGVLVVVATIGTFVAFATALVLGALFPFGGINQLWPYTSIQLASDRGAAPDLDLHVRCPDGRHVGMNYSTGAYENQVAGSITNGDNLGAPEWILFPPTPENAGCVHSVSARDNRAFLDANPDVAAALGSATDSYAIYARYIDPASGIFTSETLEGQVIEPGQSVIHGATGTSDISILTGIPDLTPPVTTASASGTLGADGATYISDVTVTLSAQDDASGILETRYSLDGGLTYVPYPGQILLTVEGDRTVTYYSQDGGGNVEAPKTITVKIDKTAPDTTIDSGPAATTNAPTASFSFSSDDPGALFDCSLDGASFMACASPISLTSLAIGAHAFSVRAVDSAGNQDPTPTTWNWTIAPAAAARVAFLRHTVQIGTTPGSIKAPVQGAAVKAFSTAFGSCAFQVGQNPHDYATVLSTCAPDGAGATDASGTASIGLAPGQYLLLARDPQTGVVAGVASGALALGETADKFLQVIVRADGTSVPAKTTKRVGSLLYIIEPEYIEWSQVQELYPFVFDAPEGDWGLTVTVSPPEGFVSDHDSLSTELSNDYKALQFTLTDIGSCWECGTSVDIEIRHEGKIERLARRIPTPMTERFVREKGLSPSELEARGVRVTRKKR